MGKLTLIRPSPPIKAVGIALDLLHLQEPFAKWPAHELVSTVKGAIKREHYILIKEDEKYVGLACWGLCSEETGTSYISGEARPSYSDCAEGDNLLLFIIYAQKSSQLKSLTAFIKKHHPGHKVFGRRFRKDQPKLASKRVLIR